MVSADRKDIAVDTLPLVVGQPYPFEMTVNVNPKKPGTRYKPYVSISWMYPGESMRGTVEGDALSLPIEEVGTWAWTSVGAYTWQWQGPGLQYQVIFNG